MKIENLVHGEAVTVAATAELVSAARRMWREDVGCLPVLCDGHLVGIISESDLVRAMAHGADARKALVADHMSLEPKTISPTEDTQDAARLMASLQVRHLPVVDRAGRVVGVVSARDLANLEAWAAAR